jgi:inner membrane protein
MASFGHVAFGLVTSRLHGGRHAAGQRRCSWGTLLAFAGLAVLPDADVFLVALGTSDSGAVGHRGASHSLAFAVAIGLLFAVAARRAGWPVLRTAVAGTLAVASHALLDLLCASGRGLPLLWPFSATRFHCPLRIFPDAPRGMKLLSRPGVMELVIEFALFLPMTIFAFWPQLTGRRAGRRRPSRGHPPVLTVVVGGGVPAPVAPAPVAPAPGDTLEAPLRSSQ